MSLPPSRHDPIPPPPSSRAVSDLLVSADFLESFPDAAVVVDTNGAIIQLNSQAEELFRYQRGDLIGQKVEILVPEPHRRRHHAQREAFGQSPRIRRMGQGLDLYGRRRDGSEFPVEISLSPVETGEGTLVLSAIRDISERKRIEEALRRVHLDRKTTQEIGENRSRLAAIIDSSNDAILGKSLDGTITA